MKSVRSISKKPSRDSTGQRNSALAIHLEHLRLSEDTAPSAHPSYSASLRTPARATWGISPAGDLFVTDMTTPLDAFRAYVGLGRTHLVPEERTTSSKQNPMGGATSAPGSLYFELARLAFAALFRGQRASDEEFLVELMREHGAELVLEAALLEFATKGNQDRLVLFSELLSELGRDGLECLRAISLAHFEGRSAFVELVAAAPFLSAVERFQFLRQIVNTGDQATRWRVLEVIGCLPLGLQSDLLRILEGDPSTEIADEAKAYRRDFVQS